MWVYFCRIVVCWCISVGWLCVGVFLYDSCVLVYFCRIVVCGCISVG